MSNDNKTRAHLTVPLTPELKRKARIEAAHRGVSMSDLVRHSLERELSAPATTRDRANETPQHSVAANG